MATLEELCQDEWVTTQGARSIRLRFRKDGSGFYERKETGKPVVVEKLLFKVEGNLKIKLARARSWTEVQATVKAGSVAADARLGQHELVLSHDPYVVAIEDQQSGELHLVTDEGASLPSA